MNSAEYMHMLDERPVAMEYNEYPTEVGFDVPPPEVDVNVVPTLEEAATDFQYGCKEAFDYLYRYYEGKMHYNAAKYADEDVVQELSMVLLRCARRYRTGGSASFNTFFWGCAQNHLGMYTEKKKAKKRCPDGGVASLNVRLASDGDAELEDMVVDTTNEQTFDEATFRSMLETQLFPFIDVKDRFIITKLCAGVSVASISQLMGISTPGVYNRIKKMRAREVPSAFFEHMRRSAHGGI